MLWTVEDDLELDPEMRQVIEESLRTFQMVEMRTEWDVGLRESIAELQARVDS